MAFAVDMAPAAAHSSLDFPALTFVQGAPPPLLLMALGALLMGVTFSRRVRKVRARS